MKARDLMSSAVMINKNETLSHALEVMDKNNTRRLLATNDGEIVGVLTYRSLTENLGSWTKSTRPASAMHVSSGITDDYARVLPDLDAYDAARLLENSEVLVVVEDGVLGWITPKDVITHLRIDGYAAEVMSEALEVSPGDRVVHLRRLMLDQDMSRAVVVEDFRVVGIVTERDVTRGLRAIRDLVEDSRQEHRIRNLIVEDIMSMNVESVRSNTPLEEVIDTLVEEDVGGLPVLNLQDEVVGMVTRRDIVRAIARAR